MVVREWLEGWIRCGIGGCWKRRGRGWWNGLMEGNKCVEGEGKGGQKKMHCWTWKAFVSLCKSFNSFWMPLFPYGNLMFSYGICIPHGFCFTSFHLGFRVQVCRFRVQGAPREHTFHGKKSSLGAHFLEKGCPREPTFHDKWAPWEHTFLRRELPECPLFMKTEILWRTLS